MNRPTYQFRSGAARSAFAKAWPSFFCCQGEDEGTWYPVRTEGEVIEAAELWAEDYDWVDWIEEDGDGLLTAFVTLPQLECLDICKDSSPLPSWLTLAPITPSLWQPDTGSVREKTGRLDTDRAAIVYTRPRPGGKTARIWEISDELGNDREAVLAQAAKEGLNPAMAGTQFSRWRKTTLSN